MLAPCPLAKEQVTQHPRRVYYFLAGQPRQPIPEYVEPQIRPLMNAPRVLSPNPSSGTEDEGTEEHSIALLSGASDHHDALESVNIGQQDKHWGRARQGARDPSPSPSVDLGSSYADVDDSHNSFHVHSQSISGSFAEMSFNPTPSRGFSFITQSLARDHETSMSRSQSPPLEHDEKEFTRTASVMQLRKASEQAERSARASTQSSARGTPFEPSGAADEMQDDAMVEQHSYFEEAVAQMDNESAKAEDATTPPEHNAAQEAEDAEALFGPQSHHLLPLASLAHLNSSPMLHPTDVNTSVQVPPATLSGNQGNKPGVETRDHKTTGDDMLPLPKMEIPTNNSEYEDPDYDLRSPECVDLSELDDLFCGY